MCYCDAEQPAFINETLRIARKRHYCTECSSTIEAGARYVYITGKWDQRVSTHKRCEACAALAVLVCCDVLGDLLGSAKEALDGLLYVERDHEKAGKLGGLLWLARERQEAAYAEKAS
jgi:hypothetical protein